MILPRWKRLKNWWTNPATLDIKIFSEMTYSSLNDELHNFIDISEYKVYNTILMIHVVEMLKTSKVEIYLGRLYFLDWDMAEFLYLVAKEMGWGKIDREQLTIIHHMQYIPELHFIDWRKAIFLTDEKLEHESTK